MILPYNNWLISESLNNNIKDIIITNLTNKTYNTYSNSTIKSINKRHQNTLMYLNQIPSTKNNDVNLNRFYKIIDIIENDFDNNQLKALKFNYKDLIEVRNTLQNIQNQGYILNNKNVLGQFLPITLINDFNSISTNAIINPIDVLQNKDHKEHYALMNILNHFKPKQSIKTLIKELIHNKKIWTKPTQIPNNIETKILNDIESKVEEHIKNNKTFNNAKDAIANATIFFIWPQNKTLKLSDTEILDLKITNKIKYNINPKFDDNSKMVIEDVDRIRSNILKAIKNKDIVKANINILYKDAITVKDSTKVAYNALKETKAIPTIQKNFYPNNTNKIEFELFYIKKDAQLNYINWASYSWQYLIYWQPELEITSIS